MAGNGGRTAASGLKLAVLALIAVAAVSIIFQGPALFAEDEPAQHRVSAEVRGSTLVVEQD